jgi:hypothetical protein
MYDGKLLTKNEKNIYNNFLNTDMTEEELKRKMNNLK